MATEQQPTTPKEIANQVMDVMKTLPDNLLRTYGNHFRVKAGLEPIPPPISQPGIGVDASASATASAGVGIDNSQPEALPDRTNTAPRPDIDRMIGQIQSVFDKTEITPEEKEQAEKLKEKVASPLNREDRDVDFINNFVAKAKAASLGPQYGNLGLLLQTLVEKPSDLLSLTKLEQASNLFADALELNQSLLRDQLLYIVKNMIRIGVRTRKEIYQKSEDELNSLGNGNLGEYVMNDAGDIYRIEEIGPTGYTMFNMLTEEKDTDRIATQGYKRVTKDQLQGIVPEKPADEPPVAETVNIPESLDEFVKVFPAMDMKGIKPTVSEIEDVEVFPKRITKLETFVAEDQPISALALYDKEQDALGAAVSPDGIINLVVADGVSTNVLPWVASRLTVRGALDQMTQATLSEATLKAAYDTIQDAPIEKMFADRMQKIRDDYANKTPFERQDIESYIQGQEELVERGKYASTTFVAAQYDRDRAKLRIGLRGDSSVVIFRKNGQIETFLNPSAPGNLTYGLRYTPLSNREGFRPYDSDIHQETDLQDGDVAMLCTDGLVARRGVYQKIQDYLMKQRALNPRQRLDQKVIEYIKTNLEECITEDDVSALALHHLVRK